MTLPKKTTSVLKKTNSFEILRALYISGVKTRMKLSHELHLSLPTISRSIEPYLGDLVTIEGKAKSNGGRRPDRLIFNYYSRKIGGIQVDENFFILSLSNLDRKPVVSERISFNCSNPSSLAKKIRERLTFYSKKGYFDPNDLEVLTIAVAGTVSDEALVAYDSPLKWKNVSPDTFFDDGFFSDFPNCTVLFENDANALAIGELADRGYGKENLVAVYLSKGIGIGIITQGRLYSGSHGRAGEIGKFVPLFSDETRTFEEFFNTCPKEKKTRTLFNLLNNLFLLFDPVEVVLSWNEEREKIDLQKFKKMIRESGTNETKWEVSKHGKYAVVNGALAISGMMFLEKKVYGRVGQNYMIELV